MSNYSVSLIGTTAAGSRFTRVIQAATRATIVAASLFASTSVAISTSSNLNNITSRAAISISSNPNDIASSASYVDAKSAVQQKLHQLQDKYGALTPAISDAQIFAASMPSDVAVPAVWTDGTAEIAFEWEFRSRRAFVTFEGDGEYGYTLKIGDKFVPGGSPGRLGQFPADLLNYLRGKA